MTAYRNDSEDAGQEGAAGSRKNASWITHGSLIGATWRLALPMIVTGLLHDSFSIVDLFFVGRLGPEAIAAVTISGIVVAILLMIGLGITVGCTALVSQAIGAGNRDRASMVTIQGLLMAAVLSLVTAAAFPFASSGLKILGAGPEVVKIGTSYLQISLIGSFTMYMSITFAAVLRGAGDAVTPMKVIGLGNLINIALDPIFIFGWIGIPAFGVTGSAIATVIARFIAMALLAKVFFVDGHEHFRLHVRDLRPHGKTIWEMLKIGVFSSGQMLTRNLSALALVSIVAFYGTVVHVAAYGIGIRLWMAVLMPGMGFGNAAETLVGQNLGARKPERSVRAAWFATGMCAAFALAAGIAFILFAEPLVAVFSSKREVVATGSSFLFWLGATMPFLAFSLVLGRAMNGAGDTLWPMLTTAVAMLAVRIPLAYGLANAWQSPTGVWVALAVSNVLQGVMFVLVFWWGRWKKIGEKHVASADLTSEIEY